MLADTIEALLAAFSHCDEPQEITALFADAADNGQLDNEDSTAFVSALARLHDLIGRLLERCTQKTPPEGGD